MKIEPNVMRWGDDISGGGSYKMPKWGKHQTPEKGMSFSPTKEGGRTNVQLGVQLKRNLGFQNQMGRLGGRTVLVRRDVLL